MSFGLTLTCTPVMRWCEGLIIMLPAGEGTRDTGAEAGGEAEGEGAAEGEGEGRGEGEGEGRAEPPRLELERTAAAMPSATRATAIAQRPSISVCCTIATDRWTTWRA